MILGIDPGRKKCGLAVVNWDEEVLWQGVVLFSEIKAKIFTIEEKYDINKVVVGDGTASEKIQKMLREFKLNFKLINEANSTLEAKRLYWAENTPQGMRKLVPTNLQSPPQAVDDYAALVLAKKYLKKL